MQLLHSVRSLHIDALEMSSCGQGAFFPVAGEPHFKSTRTGADFKFGDPGAIHAYQVSSESVQLSLSKRAVD